MSLALILSFIQSNSATILGIWVLIEQLLAANPNIKANSTFQLATNLIRLALSKKA